MSTKMSSYKPIESVILLRHLSSGQHHIYLCLKTIGLICIRLQTLDFILYNCFEVYFMEHLQLKVP